MKLEVRDLSSERALVDEEQITLNPLDFNDKFLRPTHRVNVKVSRLSGRCGNLVVVQLKGGKHANENQKATLRSLGLGKISQASLRTVNAVNLGYINTVRHLVGVVALRTTCYKEGIQDPFESQQFGTPSKPGEICRSSSGEYIGYQADRHEFSVYMSTRHSFEMVLVQLATAGLEVDMSSRDTWLAYGDDGGSILSARGSYANISDKVDSAAVIRARLPVKTYGRVNKGTLTAAVTWRADVERFHDISRVSHEIGILGSNSTFGVLRSFKEAFADPLIQATPLVRLTLIVKGKKVETIL